MGTFHWRSEEFWRACRGEGKNMEVRLKTFDNIRAALEEPERFLMISGEEISGPLCGNKNIPLNALNLTETIEPRQAATVAETKQLALEQRHEREERQHRRRGRALAVVDALAGTH